MRWWPTLILLSLLAALQYPLWFGKGGWTKVRESETQVQGQRDANSKLEARNAGLAAEVRDLKTGYEAIEERARYDLGLVKPGETFVQVPARSPK
ncbi:cell division protein FtsB [Niveibacterium sp. SC-1]|uniref:cell division protein FtsB n=1 Tax=Niveibacterium sp. SC-1 TaxID=3135646 RepID=UPI00311EEB12